MKTHLRQAARGSIFVGCACLFLLLVQSAAHAGAIAADHREFQEVDRIPRRWIEKAKELTIHYAHTSHGSLITSGVAAVARRERMQIKGGKGVCSHA